MVKKLLPKGIDKTAGIFLIGFCLFLISFGAQSTQAVTLTVGDNSGLPGETITIAVDLTSKVNESIAGLNFDLGFDSTRLTISGVSAGQVVTDAGKSLSYSEPAAGIVRILIFGLNQDIIADGVIADVSFDIQPTASAGPITLSLSSAAVTNPGAQAISVTTVNGLLTIMEGANNPSALDSRR